jgi:hypothetical protein
VDQIAEELIETSPRKEIDPPVIHAPINDYLHERPLGTDVERAHANLARVGFNVEERGRR